MSVVPHELTFFRSFCRSLESDAEIKRLKKEVMFQANERKTAINKLNMKHEAEKNALRAQISKKSGSLLDALTGGAVRLLL